MQLTQKEWPGFNLLPAAMILAAGLFLVTVPAAQAALTIHLSFLPGTPPTNMVGGGTLESLVTAAAKNWERAFSDPSDSWDVYLNVEWAPLGNRGQFTLYTQGGSPHREQSGLIQFCNTGEFAFFADPTPGDNCEYQTYTEYTNDLGGGVINFGRVYSNPTGEAAGRHDLLSLAEHEIGHALGMSQDNIAFRQQIPGNALKIFAPRPHAGTEAFMFSDHLQYSHVLMFPYSEGDERVLISGLDILAEAQLSLFNKPTLNPYAVVRHPPYITSINIADATLTLQGTNGAPNGQYVLLSSTNLSLPVIQWTHVLTNAFDCRGNSQVSTGIVPANKPRQFYILSQ